MGHGAYLGPDYSAEYLHRLSEITRDTIATEKYGRLFAQLFPDQQSAAAAQTIAQLRKTGTTRFPAHSGSRQAR